MSGIAGIWNGIKWSGGMEIRQFRESDELAVVELWTTVFNYPAPHNNPAKVIRDKLALQRDLFFVAVEQELVAGTVMGGYDGHRGWIYSLAVLPEFRRRGMATALMNHVEAELRKLGCCKINLQILPGNVGVADFYNGLGYVIEERISMGKLL